MQAHILAAAVASRICHDLVSPVGAVANGVDLVREMGGADPETTGMIGQSAERASALLQFHRIAFGAAEPGAAEIGRPALAERMQVLAVRPRITLHWDGREGAPLPRSGARLIALLLLCARAVTAMRGAILLKTGAGPALPLSVTVDAESFSAAVEMLGVLGGEASPETVSPRNVEFVLAREAAQAMGVALAVERGEGRVAIEASG